MEQRTEKHGLYTFEFDTELVGSVKITNKEGKSFFVMGSALKGLFASVLRASNIERANKASSRDLLGF